MKDPFSLSDTDEDKAVEDLLSQANDHAVLDQIAAINCSGFTDSALPSDLESRFHRLKTFPNSFSTTPTKPPNHPKLKPSSLPHSLSAPHPNPDSNHHQPQPQPRKPTSLRFESSDAASLTGSALRPKSLRRRSLSPASDSSPSPPRRSGCLWVFSRRRKKEGKGKRKEGGSELRGWDKTEELLADLGSFSVREQRRILKAAVEEQRKMKEEARKIVKMAKQASARMNISDIEDDDGSLESL